MDAQVRSFKQGQVSEDEARALLARINHDHNARYTPAGLAEDPAPSTSSWPMGTCTSPATSSC